MLFLLEGNILGLYFKGILVLPSSQAVYAIKSIILKNSGILELFPIVLNLGIFATVSILIAVITFKFVERKAMLRI